MWSAKRVWRAAGYARAAVIGWAAVAAGLVLPARADAGFSYRVDPGSATLVANQPAVQFTVYLDADTPQQVGGPIPDVYLTDFQVQLKLIGTTSGATDGVSFGAVPSDIPAAPTNAASPYIFAGNQFLDGQVFLENISDGGLTITIGDLANVPAPLNPGLGQSWALGSFTVGYAGSPAGGAVRIVFDQDNSIVDQAVLDPGTGLPLLDPVFGFPTSVLLPDTRYPTVDAYQLDVHGTGDVTAVPAPPGAVLLAAGWGCLALTRLVRRRPTAASAETV